MKYTADKTNDISEKYAIYFLPTKYLIDKKGNIVCKKGQTLTIDEIESMDYLVDGVIGSTK